MPTLYIGNGTKQHHHFLARLPETTKLYERNIPIGQQIAIKDLTIQSIEDVVRHHSQYGMVDAKAADKGKNLNVLLYQVDKPIPGLAIDRAINHNNEVLTAKGEEQRKLAAVAIDASISAAVGQAGLAHTGTSVEVIEQPKSGDDDGPKLNEAIVVKPEGNESVPEAVARGRRRK